MNKSTNTATPKSEPTTIDKYKKESFSLVQVSLVGAGILVGAILLAIASGVLPLNKAHAQDVATVDAVTQVEASVDAGTAAAVAAEVKGGSTCEVTLPADTGIYDKVKAKFAQLGCEVSYYTSSTTGDTKVEVALPNKTDVPTPAVDTK
jgi:hypothetical protein